MNESTHHHPARIIDANANRAREAMRVLEDGARFLLDDEAVSLAFKSLRHDLVSALKELPPGLLEAHRATESDIGRTLTVATEGQRADPRAVIEAAGARMGEALRSIEEWIKTIDPAVAGRVEAVRYRGYEAAGALLQRLPGSAPQWRLCVLVSQDACLRPPLEVIKATLAGGTDCLQIREKSMTDQDLLAWVREVVALARPLGAAVIVNDRVDIALAARADGVHLGTGDLPIAEARLVAGHRLLIGSSAHDLEEAGAAIRAGCDLCGLGTMYASTTKPECVPSGPSFLASFLTLHPDLPHLAIGGIDAARAAELAALGCRGVAVSSSVCAAEDPEAATRLIHQSITGETSVKR
jgi:thiamine-phosphate pyrophosphorylase